MVVKSRILVVDDDTVSRKITEATLGRDYMVFSASDGQQALEIIRQHPIDLILMDLYMPVMDGLTACGLLREQLSEVAVIMLSAETDSEHRTEAFLKGVDDFISKPVTPAELMARVQAKLRRRTPIASELQLTCGNLVLEISTHSVRIDGTTLELSKLQFDLIKMFLPHCNVVFSRSQILQEIWKDTSVSQRTIDHHIVGLRKALKNFDHQIESIYGVGYVLKCKPCPE